METARAGLELLIDTMGSSLIAPLSASMPSEAAAETTDDAPENSSAADWDDDGWDRFAIVMTSQPSGWSYAIQEP